MEMPIILVLALNQYLGKMKILLYLLLFSATCFAQHNSDSADVKEIATAVDQWHKAAATANFDSYFSFMTKDAVFIGTDHTEKWNKNAFMAYSKPHFDKGKAWSFTAFDREIKIYTKDVAWFDELLITQMGICRGSGIMKKENGHWKIDRYVLSMSIPNDNSDDVVKIKAPIEDAFLKDRIK